MKKVKRFGGDFSGCSIEGDVGYADIMFNDGNRSVCFSWDVGKRSRIGPKSTKTDTRKVIIIPDKKMMAKAVKEIAIIRTQATDLIEYLEGLDAK